jgi:hypothetical protein
MITKMQLSLIFEMLTEATVLSHSISSSFCTRRCCENSRARALNLMPRQCSGYCVIIFSLVAYSVLCCEPNRSYAKQEPLEKLKKLAFLVIYFTS